MENLSAVKTGHVGWIEFITDGERATTHIAYAYEDGSVYLPEGPEVVTELDFRLAAATSRFWPMRRESDLREEIAQQIESAVYTVNPDGQAGTVALSMKRQAARIVRALS